MMSKTGEIEGGINMKAEEIRLSNKRYYEILENAYDFLDSYKAIGSMPSYGHADFENAYFEFGAKRGEYNEKLNYEALCDDLIKRLHEGEKAAYDYGFEKTGRDFENIALQISWTISGDIHKLFMTQPEYLEELAQFEKYRKEFEEANKENKTE